MDNAARKLERNAAFGDPQATQALAAQRARAGECPWCQSPVIGGLESSCCCYPCWRDCKGGRTPGEPVCPNCPAPKAARSIVKRLLDYGGRWAVVLLLFASLAGCGDKSRPQPPPRARDTRYRQVEIYTSAKLSPAQRSTAISAARLLVDALELDTLTRAPNTVLVVYPHDTRFRSYLFQDATWSWTDRPNNPAGDLIEVGIDSKGCGIPIDFYTGLYLALLPNPDIHDPYLQRVSAFARIREGEVGLQLGCR